MHSFDDFSINVLGFGAVRVMWREVRYVMSLIRSAYIRVSVSIVNMLELKGV